MQNTSATYKDLLTKNYTTETALLLGGSGAVSSCNDSQLRAMGIAVFREDVLISMKTSSSAFASGKPSVGSCVAKTIGIKMLAPSINIPRGCRLVPFVRITDGNTVSEWLPKGVFHIDTRKTDKDIGGDFSLELTGLDDMMKTEQMYKTTSLGNNPTDISVVNEIASRIGVQVDSRTTSAINRGYRINPVGDFTYREVLGFIAAMYGGNFVMSDDGKLRFVPLKGGA